MDFNQDGYADLLVVASGFAEQKVSQPQPPSAALLLLSGGKVAELSAISPLHGESHFGSDTRIDESGEPSVFWTSDDVEDPWHLPGAVCSLFAVRWAWIAVGSGGSHAASTSAV